MLKRLAALMIVFVTMFGLQACSGSAPVSLLDYVNSYQGYQFSYPTGWIEVKVTGGPDVVFHDIINVTENVSVVVSPVAEGKTLEELGGPSEVGYKLSKSITDMAGDSRDVELLNAQNVETPGGKTYYILEYLATTPDGQRHNLASAIVRRGQLFTFNASVPEARWKRLKNSITQSVASFSVY
ncbi:photosystem ii oxygen evolving complex protein [Leptolyngbya sp. Heron Island J]|uniref:photosystem II reaction center PsbP n=1 Tax=Leptolyngbya sp. Heron Island J TaxID=1385935 RepID=UPI0003B9F29A|nr:photosystem II reaction center PsbP [Leptolyngbya sp. Heron Island J]ESA36812.1 photosystem ii oxygen evolving complex protein [Leptolyngbya sp. Heron Island J]